MDLHLVHKQELQGLTWDALPMALDDLEWAIPRIRCDLHERSHSSHDCGVPPSMATISPFLLIVLAAVQCILFATIVSKELEDANAMPRNR